MNPLQQIVERKRLAMEYDDFAVEPVYGCLQFERGADQLGKVAGEVFARLRAEIDLAALAGQQAAEAVPFRLILPFGAARNGIGGTRLHRRQRRRLRRFQCGVSARGRHALSTPTAGYSPAVFKK